MEDRIPTNLRTLLILEVLGRSDRALSPTEINQSIGLPKQTIHRLCAKLEHEGFLAREEDGKNCAPRGARGSWRQVFFMPRAITSRVTR